MIDNAIYKHFSKISFTVQKSAKAKVTAWLWVNGVEMQAYEYRDELICRQPGSNSQQQRWNKHITRNLIKEYGK